MHYLDATTDIAFKKLFGDQKHARLTMNFLNSVLRRTEGSLITKIIITSGENQPLTLEGKRSLLDINCIDQQGNNYIVEIQKQNQGDFVPRAQYYVGNALAQQLEASFQYAELVPVIFVGVVVNFELFPGMPDFLSHHGIVNFKTGKQSHFHSEYHYLELKKFTKQEDALMTDVEKWAYLLKHARDLDHIPSAVSDAAEFVEAFQILEHGMWNHKDLAAYRAEQELLYKDEKIETTARKEGLEEGLAKGREEEKKEIARQMLANGIDSRTISIYTGLTCEEIECLRSGR